MLAPRNNRCTNDQAAGCSQQAIFISEFRTVSNVAFTSRYLSPLHRWHTFKWICQTQIHPPFWAAVIWLPHQWVYNWEITITSLDICTYYIHAHPTTSLSSKCRHLGFWKSACLPRIGIVLAPANVYVHVTLHTCTCTGPSEAGRLGRPKPPHFSWKNLSLWPRVCT